MNNSRHFIFVSLAGLLMAVLTTAAADASEKKVNTRTIAVQAYGEVHVVPNVLVTRFSISEQGKNIVELKQAVDEKLSGVQGLFQKAGVSEKHYRMMQLQINPQYDWKNGRTLKGYEVRRDVELRLHDVEQFGVILDGVVKAGVNHTGHVQLLSSNQQALETSAAAKAVQEARSKAQKLARAGGAKIGQILSIQESGSHSPQPRPMAMRMAAMAEADAVPVQNVGESIIRKSVNVVFELK